MARGYLVLEDGTTYDGELFGSTKGCDGEVVFETGMDGYQESLTDPSGRGSILVMTYPIVGNYGIRDEYNQSDEVHVRGLVVREYCKEPSPMYGGRTLESFMVEHDVPGISGVDTRDLVIKIRKEGTVKGAIVSADADIDAVVNRLKSMPAPSETNLVAEVSCKSILKEDMGKDVTVGLLDLGAKAAISKELRSRFNLVTFPYDTPADVIIESGVEGLVVSNAPGDPSHPDIMATTVKTVRELAGKVPLFGICTGCQIIALAMGARTYKMKFGHRGCNQPVKYGSRVYITSQNHGYAVDESSLEGTGLIADQVNVNDGSVEGFRHKELPILATQYHPEACPGSSDTAFIFDDFARMVKEAKQ